MSKSFDVTVTALQLFLLALWEGVGVIYFGWAPLAIFLVWFISIWTLNISVATVMRMFIKLTQVPEAGVAPVEENEVG